MWESDWLSSQHAVYSPPEGAPGRASPSLKFVEFVEYFDQGKQGKTGGKDVESSEGESQNDD